MAIAGEILRFTLKKHSYSQINFFSIILYVPLYFSIFGKKKDEGLQWCMAFEENNMCFLENGP